MKSFLFILPIIALLYNPMVYNQTISEDYNRGMDFYNRQLYAEAQKVFNQIIKDYGVEDELYASARFYSANSLLKMGKKDEAASEFEFIANNIVWSQFREESLFTLGLIYFDFKRYALCRKNLLMLIYQYPGSEHTGTAMYWVGESYAAEGKLDEAIDFLKQAIEDKSNNKFRDYSLYALANVYEKTKDYNNAVKYYDELLTYHSNSPLAVQAQVRIGVCYFYLKDYYNSILELSNPNVKELSNNNLAEALYILANSHYRVEEYENAVKIYSEIIEKFPGSKIFRNAQYGLG
ncbi:MAG: tetratricopeptide repeat protein, partial [Ignavibacteriaceae bacterium]